MNISLSTEGKLAYSQQCLTPSLQTRKFKSNKNESTSKISAILYKLQVPRVYACMML